MSLPATVVAVVLAGAGLVVDAGTAARAGVSGCEPLGEFRERNANGEVRQYFTSARHPAS